ncbi:hypothetical protein IWQ47_000974 [Aquimarina sp. EL_43]|uniref:hypothetical protein n=1 Tax=unclassified Aquimarina TaxID=2627091 RepID=UPI0018C95112|nr:MULTISPECIES: hypothetical protein [unclassified Aquimarina]MBG6129724.1 hypothetical protein [Aquimarina sp. EL_35]MBG6150789.1 hypothetical protein [Aquimarina sp. EL_32]MBG6167904.1 hypothetical protein [Aquimarina sp. EL_43]
MNTKKLIGLIVIFGILACNSDDDNNNTDSCDQLTIINSKQYVSEPNHNLTISSLKINGNCLKISFGSSGCSGDTWELKLIDSEEILETNPPQRNLRLSLKNEELCNAFITKEISFNILGLKVDGNKVLLNIKNSDDQILYEY